MTRTLFMTREHVPQLRRTVQRIVEWQNCAAWDTKNNLSTKIL
ncbi:acetolactate synthase domain protein [Corynebacterium simulans]|uniref:Acetolactate synthase domain protein n=1 Tax=Corynebacterium simulans TaxID=146827 RepID=A0ABR5V9N0_9CORY|nr:acetolactate synthase domain protein [Corynebacterium simulans]